MPNPAKVVPLVIIDNETHQSNNTDAKTAVMINRFIAISFCNTKFSLEPANATAAQPLAWNKVHQPCDKIRLEIIVAITANAIPRLAPRDAPITKHITVRGCTFGKGSSKIRLAAAAAVILASTKISLFAE